MIAFWRSCLFDDFHARATVRVRLQGRPHATSPLWPPDAIITMRVTSVAWRHAVQGRPERADRSTIASYLSARRVGAQYRAAQLAADYSHQPGSQCQITSLVMTTHGGLAIENGYWKTRMMNRFRHA